MVKAWKGKNKQKENVYLGIQVREQYILGQSLGMQKKKRLKWKNNEKAMDTQKYFCSSDF